MKRNALVSLSVLLLLSVSSAAFAYNEIVVSGDCDGWTMSASLMFGTPDYMDIEYEVDLYDETGAIVYSLFVEETIHRDNADFTVRGSWDLDLCGDYTLHVALTFYGPWGTYTDNADYAFTCECMPTTCMYTPGFWKNHEEDWPVMELTVGCVEYSQSDLLRILDMPTRGDLTIKLFHHLLAAKLNVLYGADDYIMGAINDGDAFLCEHPLGCKPFGDLKKMAVAIKDELQDYNQTPCYCDTPDVMFSIEGSSDLDKAAAATEETTWGSIKQMHK